MLISTTVPNIQAKHDSRLSHQTSTATIITVGEVEYYLHHAPAHVLSFHPSHPSRQLFLGLDQDLLPCTVIDWSKDQLNKDDLEALTANFALHDDVWTPAFLQGETRCRPCNYNQGVANSMTPSNSRHSPNAPKFQSICRARWSPYSLGSQVYSFADWSLCNPTINWRNPPCIAFIPR